LEYWECRKNRILSWNAVLRCDVRTQGDCMRLSKMPPWGLILCQEIADFYAKEATQSLQRLNY